MQRRLRSLGIVMMLGALVIGLFPQYAAATTAGTTEGCSPGYWKNHASSWKPTGYTTSANFAEVFGLQKTGVANVSLMDGLKYGGGSGVDGARRTLVRAAAAALLNASYPGLLFPWQRHKSVYRPPLLETVRTTYQGGSRTSILALAYQLDRDNNLGCPLH